MTNKSELLKKSNVLDKSFLNLGDQLETSVKSSPKPKNCLMLLNSNLLFIGDFYRTFPQFTDGKINLPIAKINTFQGGMNLIELLREGILYSKSNPLENLILAAHSSTANSENPFFGIPLFNNRYAKKFALDLGTVQYLLGILEPDGEDIFEWFIQESPEARSELDQLISLLKEFRKLKLKRLILTSCNVGVNKEYCETLKMLFGVRELIAPISWDYYAKVAPIIADILMFEQTEQTEQTDSKVHYLAIHRSNEHDVRTAIGSPSSQAQVIKVFAPSRAYFNAWLVSRFGPHKRAIPPNEIPIHFMYSSISNTIVYPHTASYSREWKTF